MSVDFRVMQNQTRYIKCAFLILFLINNLLISQEMPVDLNHPVNDFIFRYHTKGIVKTIHPGNPLIPFGKIFSSIPTNQDSGYGGDISESKLYCIINTMTGNTIFHTLNLLYLRLYIHPRTYLVELYTLAHL